MSLTTEDDALGRVIRTKCVCDGCGADIPEKPANLGDDGKLFTVLRVDNTGTSTPSVRVRSGEGFVYTFNIHLTGRDPNNRDSAVDLCVLCLKGMLERTVRALARDGADTIVYTRDVRHIPPKQKERNETS